MRLQCDVLDVYRSGYYAWRARPASARERSDERLAVEIAATHAKSKKRSPRVHRALRKKGIRVGKKRVARLRDFEPAAANQVWAGDVTYVATGEGWAYLAVLLDLFSRRVVGRAMSVAGHERHQRHGARAEGARERCPRASLAPCGPRPPHRPREPLCERGLPCGAFDVRDDPKHEPERRLLGQRRCRELLRNLRAELVDAERYVTCDGAERSIASRLREPDRACIEDARIEI